MSRDVFCCEQTYYFSDCGFRHYCYYCSYYWIPCDRWIWCLKI